MNRIHCSLLDICCSDECLPITTGKSKHHKKAEVARFPRIFGRKKRGLLQRKERYARKGDYLQDTLDCLNDGAKTPHEGVTIGQVNLNLNINKRRRMATCEQLEKITKVTSHRNVTLYDVRKALVVVNRSEDYGLL